MKPKRTSRYSMALHGSDEDELFLITIPECGDRVIMPYTHGKTRAEAILHAEEVIEMYVEAWKAEGEPISQPVKLQVVCSVGAIAPTSWTDLERKKSSTNAG